MGYVMNREGYLVGKTERECTARCGAFFTITSKTVTICPKCNVKRVQKRSPQEHMHNAAQQRSRVSGLEFTITQADINIPETCPILGMPLVRHVGSPGGRPNSPALDRIDNALGYIPGNVQVISHLANMMKSHANEEQLFRFGTWAVKEYGPKLKQGKKTPPVNI